LTSWVLRGSALIDLNAVTARDLRGRALIDCCGSPRVWGNRFLRGSGLIDLCLRGSLVIDVWLRLAEPNYPLGEQEYRVGPEAENDKDVEGKGDDEGAAKQ
jgi:hypothetical protein